MYDFSGVVSGVVSLFSIILHRFFVVRGSLHVHRLLAVSVHRFVERHQRGLSHTERVCTGKHRRDRVRLLCNACDK